MAKHLTDREKKKIIADYAECGNYSQVARKHKVSFDTVKRVVVSDPETVKKAEQKKEQNTADILEFMDKKKDDVCSIISLYLSELQNSDKLQRASIQSIAHRWASLLTNLQKTRRNSLILPSLKP